GALPEVVQESGGGYVYREDEELASMLETLRAHPDLRDELGRRGHEAYLRLWSEEPHIAQYLGIIEQSRQTRVSVARP
ncbi:MAG: hypothetical protein HYX76_11350, partial [Acidobacteria bacterium]|nr:hypothetical protein [Acidobacteriota bacterium]